MFFSEPGKYTPCGMFSIGHFILIFITFFCIGIILNYTKKCSNEQVQIIIRKSTIVLWVLEIIKIAFNILVGNAKNPNNYIPLYYCSIILYAGIFSGFCKGVLKRVGDVFLSTGAVIGGLFFIICPNTSLPNYPLFHYISVQSFVFHGTMLFLGLLVIKHKYVNLNLNDITYYFWLILLMGTVSYIVNKLLGTNFMFISDNFPNTPVEYLYNWSGKLFTPIMILIQAIGPFYVMYGLIKLYQNKFRSKEQFA